MARRSDNKPGRRFVSEDWRYDITVQNLSQDVLKGLVLHYSQFVLVDDKNSSKGGVSRHKTGTAIVPPIPPMGRVMVVTDPVVAESLDRRQLNGTVIETEKWNETLRGMNVEVFWGNRMVMRWNTGSSERLGVMLTDEEKAAARREALTYRMILPAARDEHVTWNFTKENPGDDWARPDFPDASWSQGLAAFSSDGASSSGKTSPTRWTSSHIWLRRRFTLPPDCRHENLRLEVTVDDHAEVFINGKKVLRVNGPAYGQRHRLSADVIAAIDPRKSNLIAVAAHNTGGPGVIQVKLFEKVADLAAPTAP